MRKSITQEHGYGCGIACFAFACDISYAAAAGFLGEAQANSNRFIVKDFVRELNRYGKPYKASHVKPNQRIEYEEGMIILIRRSRRYPVGHYLIRYADSWMDPWINLRNDPNFAHAKSGFRKRLPGKPMYVLRSILA